MPKIPRKRSIQQYWNALQYIQASLNFHPETSGLTQEILPLMPVVEQLIRDEHEWIHSMLDSRARLLAARQNWKLKFNRLLKLLNNFEYAKVRDIQEPVLAVYPRGNRGPDYDMQVREAEMAFRKVLAEKEMPPEIRLWLEEMLKAGEEVVRRWDAFESLRKRKERLLLDQEARKTEINAALERVEKKLKKLYPYEQRYLNAFFYK